MEDISRELEKEIARSKPKSYKQERKTRIIIVDDFGKMKSGEYLKTLITTLSILNVFCFAAAVFFYSFYTDLSRDVTPVKNKLVLAEKKVDELTHEKEVLMARLVISGKEPGIMENEIEEKNTIKPELNTISESPEALAQPEIPKVIKKTVSMEKFIVTKDGENGDILVRFNIRNVSNKPGDVSGRIFTVLKSDNKLENQWLVVPTVTLKNGIPSEYKKGQYFSITHFKSVKFRIKNKAALNFFKKASVFIFNDQGVLVFEKLIDLTEAE